VVASLPSFLLLPPLVAVSQLVALMPRRLAGLFANALHILPPPVALPGFVVYASWHQRRQQEAAHIWLREQIVTAAAGMGQPANWRVRPGVRFTAKKE
jgi:DNA-binding transcriptional LysR family regulator